MSAFFALENDYFVRYLREDMKKFWYGVSIAAVGGIVAGAFLKWTPVVAVWHALEAVVSWVWGVLSFTVPFPLSLLILIVAPYLILFVLFLRNSKSDDETDDLQGEERLYGDPVNNYTADEVYGVIWHWKWRRHFDSNSPDRIHPMCPRKNCRSDLELIGYNNYLFCERCKFKKDVDGHNLLSNVEREIISRARTGNWVYAKKRLRELEDNHE